MVYWGDVQSHEHSWGITTPVSKPSSWLRPGLARLARNTSLSLFSIKHYSQSIRGGPAPQDERLLALGGSSGPGVGMPCPPAPPGPLWSLGLSSEPGGRGAGVQEGLRAARMQPPAPCSPKASPNTAPTSAAGGAQLPCGQHRDCPGGQNK